MFHDRARILVRSGRGGDGALGFRREKYVPKGGPDGGDGGRGGDVALVADARLRDLSALRGRRVFAAGRGGAGRGGRRHGADGDPVDLAVPVGTHEIVFRHPELGEHRTTTIVTFGTPARVSVDLRKK